MRTKVAVMQPYFFPYAGYFRLFAAADLFVVLDCVQFPRRGWVHRNKLADNTGKLEWFTLPLRKRPRDVTRILDLEFRPDAPTIMADQYRRFPVLRRLEASYPDLFRQIFRIEGTAVQYLVNTLQITTNILDLRRPMVRSSELPVPNHAKGVNRIIEIISLVGATHYINAPSGRHLYDREIFATAGLTLEFLDDYVGPFESILERIAMEEPRKLKEEILRNSPAN